MENNARRPIKMNENPRQNDRRGTESETELAVNQRLRAPIKMTGDTQDADDFEISQLFPIKMSERSRSL